MPTPQEFITSSLLEYKRKTDPAFEYAVFTSDDKLTFSKKFVNAFSPLLKNKKVMENKTMYYIAMRPVGDDTHWTSAVLLLRRNKPRLFILDSITHFSTAALNDLSDCMAKYGGHTYLCCSGVQTDYSSCAKFTLDALIQMHKLNNIFTYLVLARQKMKQDSPSKITKIADSDLPWQLIRNAQDPKQIDNYIHKNLNKPGIKDLMEYKEKYLITRNSKKNGAEKEVNTGIDHFSMDNF